MIPINKRTLTLMAVAVVWLVLPIVFITSVMVSGPRGALQKARMLKKGNPTKKGRYLPHILFVVIDDLGSHDLGLHGTGIQTPIANGLAKSGLFLDNYYVLPMCSPTRIAIMSGHYSYRMGLYTALRPGQSMGMDPKIETLPQVMSRGGYSTHAVGKWHLGHAKYELLPTFRGFKSFYGFYVGGGQDHFQHITHSKKHPEIRAYDLRYDRKEFCGRGCSKVVDARGKYSSDIFRDASRQVINKHNATKDGPLFLYLSYAAVHTPIQVPPGYINKYNNKKGWSYEKKVYAGMLTAADESLGKVIQALKNNGMWKDTLVIYTSDNGAPLKHPGSNSPLRGGKQDVFEGGVLVDGIISGPARNKLRFRRGKLQPLFHATDWLPTLAQMVGVSPKRKDLNGVTQIWALRTGKPARREMFLGFGVRDFKGFDGVPPKTKPRLAAYRYFRWKLVRDLKSNTNYLYNIKRNPGETKNYARKKPLLANRIWKRMQPHVDKESIPPLQTGENCGKVNKFGKTPWRKKMWIPWCNARR